MKKIPKLRRAGKIGFAHVDEVIDGGLSPLLEAARLSGYYVGSEVAVLPAARMYRALETLKTLQHEIEATNKPTEADRQRWAKALRRLQR